MINARFVKPLDEAAMLEAAASHRLLVTVEEAYLAGGFGSAVLELLEERGVADSVKLVRMGVADEIVPHGDPKKLLAKYGLNAEGIKDRVIKTLAGIEEPKKRLRVVN